MPENLVRWLLIRMVYWTGVSLYLNAVRDKAVWLVHHQRHTRRYTRVLNLVSRHFTDLSIVVVGDVLVIHFITAK